MDTTDVTAGLERTVTLFQTIIAGFLVVLLVIGVINLGSLFARSLLSGRLLQFSHVLGLIVSSIDIILYLFVVVELYKTIIAYVRAESVVIAVIHAGLIAVVRQIITFKPDEVEGVMSTITLAATHSLLLVALLIGFFVVHRQMDGERG